LILYYYQKIKGNFRLANRSQICPTSALLHISLLVIFTRDIYQLNSYPLTLLRHAKTFSIYNYYVAIKHE